MKNRFISYLAALATLFTLAACTDDEPFDTITPDDQPCILDPIFPDRTASGDLAVYQSFNRDENLNIELIVTPSRYTTVTWLLDDEPVHTGTAIDMNLQTGTYVLRVEASTASGKSTYRECLIVVNPLEGDPWSAENGLERYVAPGLEAGFTGVNLDKVAGLLLGEVPVTDFSYDAAASAITYTVPAEIAAGIYRLTLLDSEGNRYGANKVTVLTGATVLAGASTAAPGGDITLSGVKLDEVASLTIGDITVDTFSEQSATTLVFGCPQELVGGEEYTLTGTTRSGEAVLFGAADGNLYPETQILMTSEVVLWTGHFAVVNWGEANFEGVRYDLGGARVGSLLRIYFSLDPSADYCKIRLVTGDWTRLMGETDADDIVPTGDGLIEMEMTQERIDLINNNYGFMCVGHGYFVDKVTLE